jgi:hypothetical protein
VEERRGARVGTVSGLALLVGGTAVVAVAGGAHSIFATILLGLLAVGLGHAFVDEIGRQARRGSPDGWAGHDTINSVLLATWSVGTLIATVLAVEPTSVRAVGFALSIGYALSCAHFAVERRRSITENSPRAGRPPATTPRGAPEPGRPRSGQPISGQPRSGRPRSAAPPIPEQAQALPALPPDRAT